MVGQALADQADLGELDRLLGAGAVTVGALVLLAEGFFQAGDRGLVERAVLDRHGEVEGLALIVQAGEPADADRALLEAVGGELAAGVDLELPPGRVERGEVEAAQQAAEGPGVVVLDVGVEQAEGREQAGRRRHMMRRMPSSGAIAQANTGPLPPKAQSV